MTSTSFNITLTLPESVRISAGDARELILLRLLEEGRMSQSQVASSLGITLYELLDLMAKHQVPVVRYDTGQWRHEDSVLRSVARSKRGKSR